MVHAILQKLAQERNQPCVTISLNTHKTHPDNLKDAVLLKNLTQEAEKRILESYEKRSVGSLLDNLSAITAEIDHNFNEESLHVFVSNETKEIFRSSWAIHESNVHISESFSIRPLILELDRSEDYLILVLSQGGVQLYNAHNQTITGEIRNDDFPFKESRFFITHGDKGSDAKQVDNMTREFFNRVDKAVVRVHNENQLNGVVVCTPENFSLLSQVADKPGIYMGYSPVNYNNTALHQISDQSWEVVKKTHFERRSAAISEIKESISQGKVLTDLGEIFKAALNGQGELLIVNHEFAQPVKMTGDQTFDLVSDPKASGVVDDITSFIAWEVLSKKGRVVFTGQEELNDLGKIALKIRY
jgi:hypothetical protein